MSILNILSIMMKSTAKQLLLLIAIHSAVIALHWLAANAYPAYCARSGFWGIVESVLINQAPHCIALRWGITFGADHIRLMWTSLGTWLIIQITGVLN